uniref:Uncharacterized protein n=1 Tax=Entomoneis paludosa TaxID=265537 RepID=A0A7S2VA82_9STRA
MANCPLHGYYIAHHHNNATTASSSSCQEKFKFHLGLNRLPQDFMWGWDSATKFEGSFVGHSFAFRSAADPSILVETVTLQPTRIIDCPNLKRQVQVNTATTVANLQQVFAPISNQGTVGEEHESHVDPQLGWNETQTLGNTTRTTRRRSRVANAHLFVGAQSF